MRSLSLRIEFNGTHFYSEIKFVAFIYIKHIDVFSGSVIFFADLTDCGRFSHSNDVEYIAQVWTRLFYHYFQQVYSLHHVSLFKLIIKWFVVVFEVLCVDEWNLY